MPPRYSPSVGVIIVKSVIVEDALTFDVNVNNVAVTNIAVATSAGILLLPNISYIPPTHLVLHISISPIVISNVPAT